MGNKSSQIANSQLQETRSNSAATQLPYLNTTQQQIYQEYTEQTQCCMIKWQKVVRKRLIWEDNFFRNCKQIKERGNYKWIDPLFEVIKARKGMPRGKFLSQINAIKNDKTQSTNATKSQRQILLSPGQVQSFKKNLKESVLLSFGHATKMMEQLPNRITTHIKMEGRHSRIGMDRGHQFRSSHIKNDNSISANHNMNKSILRKSIMSFVDDTLSSVFGSQKQVSKGTAKALENFLKFSMTLEKHLNDNQSMLCVMRKTFISCMTKTYSDPQSTSLILPQFTASIKQFLILLRQSIYDYYNLGAMSDSEHSPNALIQNQQNILSIATAILFKNAQFYDLVFNAVVWRHRQKQDNFTKVLQKLSEYQPQSFSVKDEYCLNNRTLRCYMDKMSMQSGSQKIQNMSVSQLSQSRDQPYKSCMLILNDLSKARTPIAKMKSIMACSQHITKQISRFYASNSMQMKHWVLDADQILSIFCYIIAGAKVANLHSHLYMLQNFATEHQLISVTGYYYSVLTCAMQQLEGEYGREESASMRSR